MITLSLGCSWPFLCLSRSVQALRCWLHQTLSTDIQVVSLQYCSLYCKIVVCIFFVCWLQSKLCVSLSRSNKSGGNVSSAFISFLKEFLAKAAIRYMAVHSGRVMIINCSCSAEYILPFFFFFFFCLTIFSNLFLPLSGILLDRKGFAPSLPVTTEEPMASLWCMMSLIR